VLFYDRIRNLSPFSDEEVNRLLVRITQEAEISVSGSTEILESRDPDDNMFLSAAIEGDADYLISGDDDLLTLHPFRGVEIITPKAFLDELTDLKFVP